MKTACIYHSVDLDGWMSAAIVKYWFLSQIANVHNNHFVFNLNETNNPYGKDCPSVETMDVIGYNYGQSTPDLSEYGKVIMCDISFPIEEMERIAVRDFDNFIWLDHHISAIKGNYPGYCGIRDVEYAACELTWKFFFPDEKMPEIVRLLGRYDCFGHKGTAEEKKVLEFQYGARAVISNLQEAYRYLNECIDEEPDMEEGDESILYTILEAGHNIYSYLCTEALLSYKNGFVIVLKEPTSTSGDTETLRKFVCINKERFNPINFGIDYHKDGYDGAACFHYANGKWNFSLYNDNGEVDCSIIAKQFGGGGHKGASGFVTENITHIIN